MYNKTAHKRITEANDINFPWRTTYDLPEFWLADSFSPETIWVRIKSYLKMKKCVYKNVSEI